MTSLAFILGVVPLVFSSGAGSEMRHAMGVAVFSGMLGVTFFGLFLTPVFYVLLRGAGEEAPRGASCLIRGPRASRSSSPWRSLLSACAVGPNYKQPKTTVGERSTRKPLLPALPRARSSAVVEAVQRSAARRAGRRRA